MSRGSGAEEAVLYTNHAYRARGEALVYKVPTAQLGRLGKPDPRTGEASPFWLAHEARMVDMVGVWRGRALAFDVKETHQPRWPLRHLAPHQREFLQDWTEHGGIAFLLVCFVRRTGDCWCIWPAPALRAADRISPEELSPSLRVGPPEPGVPVPYLRTVEQLVAQGWFETAGTGGKPGAASPP